MNVFTKFKTKTISERQFYNITPVKAGNHTIDNKILNNIKSYKTERETRQLVKVSCVKNQ